MKKWIISNSQLKMDQCDVPAPKEDEILIRWHATSLNYHDFLVARGVIKVDDGRVPMSDGAGEVVEVGSNVTRWVVGDQVISLFFPDWIEGPPTQANTRNISGESFDGYACEYSCLKEEQVTRIPDGYTYGEAATLPCAALTAWRALHVEGNIEEGHQILAEGSGGMSIFAIQLGKMAGAKVHATTGNESKVERIKALGVEAVVNYNQDPKWGKTINQISNGGVDHVIDVGGNSTMRQSIEAVKVYGNIYSIGILGGPKGEILFPKLFFKHIHLIGLAVGSASMQNDMVDAIDVAGMKPVVDQSFSLEELDKAFEYQESGKHFGKIVVEW